MLYLDNNSILKVRTRIRSAKRIINCNKAKVPKIRNTGFQTIFREQTKDFSSPLMNNNWNKEAHHVSIDNDPTCHTERYCNRQCLYFVAQVLDALLFDVRDVSTSWIGLSILIAYQVYRFSARTSFIFKKMRLPH